MYVAVGQVKAAWVSGKSFHSYSHGSLKKSSNFKEKPQVGCMFHG